MSIYVIAINSLLRDPAELKYLMPKLRLNPNYKQVLGELKGWQLHAFSP